ncbi:glycosyltransferase family 4 protein [Rhodococcus sp. B50]|uniref:glycosyltransferase family 4 protein n=1 Tax=Rhodococcus sp. B50 TaxID=2682847 RepID=UPI001BD3C6C0|nr:glycosyltransferase family 4 protein [Rhodococcus sp. B50]MBS9375365.1 Phosphatidyl-myo-inositol mannosyltransferase [Rhodococcus sp. B50]
MSGSLLFVGHTGECSGAEKVMLTLVDVALAQGRRVVVACPGGPLAEALPAGCVHVRLPRLGMWGQTGLGRIVGLAGLPVRWLTGALRLRRVLAVERPRVVCNSLFALPSLRLAVAGTSHRTHARWLVHDTLSSRKQRLVARWGRAAVAGAVAVSRASAIPVRECGYPVVVAPHGVPIPPSLSRSAPRADSTARVGILASVTEWKGHRVLLDAVAQVPDVRLDVAGTPFPGDEPFLDELRRRAEQPDLRGRVSFLGRVDPAEVFAVWDVTVSASTSPEAGPLVALEAMAHGVPVVGTDHGGTAEHLADGAGILVPPGDAKALAEALRLLVTEPGLRNELVITARRRVEEHHDIEVTLPAMVDALWGTSVTL